MTTQTFSAPLTHLTDGELAQQAADGEHRAFAELVARHQSRLLAICRRVTRDEHDAQDALQNALLAAWQRIGGYQGRSSVGTWLCRVAVNSSLDELRRRGRRPDPAPDLALAGPAASDDLMTTRVALLWAMDQLPPHTRDTVLLRDHYGLSYREIAERHHTSTDAVRARLARGRRALADLLESPRRRRPVRRAVPESPAPCGTGH
ncbi:RNA polymerase sigma factor [Streptomyces sp. CA-146814]|uniref:RNA polymerase sigma factor n=1 Tax=Streptomyces sp. CA-146814 TaxID=3240053 RepID=UPI003D89E370